jgi:DNA invertase Pin-like site-specific DNA recombinase
MKIGYARVSTADQNLDLQFNALTDYGCTTIYRKRFLERVQIDQNLKNF